jgi:molecular chaperone IbpA
MNTRTFRADMLNDPFFIGFDRVLDRMHQTSVGQSNYPPYNIVKVGENNYTIDIAVAGFAEDELNIELKDGILYVEGKKKESDDTVYLHKGISTRQFRRSFTLSDTIVVRGADYHNGILYIDLENVIPEEKKPRKIAIGSSEKSEKKQFLTESE